MRFRGGVIGRKVGEVLLEIMLDLLDLLLAFDADPLDLFLVPAGTGADAVTAIIHGA